MKRSLPPVFTCLGCRQPTTREDSPVRDLRALYCCHTCKMRVYRKRKKEKERGR